MDLKSGYPFWAVSNGLMQAFPRLASDHRCDVAVLGGGALVLVRSRFGKILIAIRDREDRVRFSGYDTAHMKAFVFACGALLASLGGAFFTLQVGLIAPSVIGVVASVEMVIYAAVGGRLSIPGAVVGALVVTVAIMLVHNWLGVQPWG